MGYEIRRHYFEGVGVVFVYTYKQTSGPFPQAGTAPVVLRIEPTIRPLSRPFGLGRSLRLVHSALTRSIAPLGKGMLSRCAGSFFPTQIALSAVQMCLNVLHGSIARFGGGIARTMKLFELSLQGALRFSPHPFGARPGETSGCAPRAASGLTLDTFASSRWSQAAQTHPNGRNQTQSATEKKGVGRRMFLTQ
jgi:hypothetical protein